MKPNRLIQALRENRIPVGHMVMEFGTRGIAHILDSAGLDFVIIDMEYPAITEARVADLIGWFKATPIAPIVRIPQIEYHFITRLMSAGALGIMVPHVESAAEVKAIVDAAKYPPLGERAGAVGLANMDYHRRDIHGFMAYSNDHTAIICQIESQQGLDNLEAIAAVPGLDVLWVGHNDLSQSLGIIGQFQNARFLEALRQVVDAGKRHGLGIGAQPRSFEQAQGWIEMGFNVISYSNDHVTYADALSAAITRLRTLT